MAFITKITEYITDNYDLTKDSLCVIFPNKRAALTLRNELAQAINFNIWLPQMLSIQEAMSMWSKIQLLDNIDITFELIRIMNGSEDFMTRNNLYGMASQMVKDFDEIDQYGVNAQNLFKYLKENKETETWNPENSKKDTVKAYLKFFESLYGYYSSLREEMHNTNSGYYGFITRYLSELPDEELDKHTGDKKIIFAGFNAMTKTEEDIIVRLSNMGKAIILWDLDKYYFEDKKQEAGLFAREFFIKHRQFTPRFLNDNFRNENKVINFIAVSGSTVQADALQLNLYNEAKNKEKENDINKEAIVLADESLLIPVLNSIPNTYNNISVTMGYPYSKTILNQFILQLFPFQKKINENENIYCWSLKRLTDAEIFKVILSENESLTLSNCINHFTKSSTFNISSNELYDFINQSVKPRLNNFIKLITKKWKSPNDCIESLKSILIMINEILPKADNVNYIRNQISVAGRIINKIEKLLKKYNLLIQITDIETLYKQSSLESNIKLEHQKDGVQIMGLLEARNLDFDRIHILSVNEGILPQTKSNSSLIPNDLRINYELPIYTNKQAVYSYHFYRLIQNAKEINVYYNTLSSSTGDGEPSRFILQLKNELPKNSNIKISDVTYKNPNIDINKVVKIEVNKTDEIIAKIKNKLGGNDDCTRITGLSPTSLSCYLKCPLQFYLRHIENIKDNSTEELIQSNIIGNIIHSTFEFLYSKFGNQIIDLNIYEEVIDKHLEKSFQDALIENDFTNGLPESGFNYLSQIMIKKLIDNFIKYEKEYLRKGNTFEIKGLERQLSHSFKINGNTINLMGLADRIDKTGNTIRILDYKTGDIDENDVSIKKNVSELTDLSAKSLQLIIYKYLYAKNNDVACEFIEPAIFGLLKMNKTFFPLSNSSETFDDKCFIENCDIMFENIIAEILDKDIPFKQTDNEDDCKNCDFQNICKRNPRKAHQ